MLIVLHVFEAMRSVREGTLEATVAVVERRGLGAELRTRWLAGECRWALRQQAVPVGEKAGLAASRERHPGSGTERLAARLYVRPCFVVIGHACSRDDEIVVRPIPREFGARSRGRQHTMMARAHARASLAVRCRISAHQYTFELIDVHDGGERVGEIDVVAVSLCQSEIVTSHP